MSDEFIPEHISSSFVLLNQDSIEYIRYMIDLNTSNNENNLYHILKIIGTENIGLSSDCIYTNVNETRQNLYLKLIFTINIFKQLHLPLKTVTLLIIMHVNQC